MRGPPKGLDRLRVWNDRETDRVFHALSHAAGADIASAGRAELFHTAADLLKSFTGRLRADLTGAARQAQEQADSPLFWSLRLPTAELRIGIAEPVEPAPGLPFEVIAAAEIRLTPHDGRTRGRGHALWYCDAHTAQRFRWYETAFAPCHPDRVHLQHVPCALSPEVTEARDALAPGVTDAEYAVVWPVRELTVLTLDGFVDRWAGWLAAAAAGQPLEPGERPDASGTWRHG
ncbi:hypothetical protein [Streptomyces sp. NPDC052225]|uniref:hypothetical protein n=1 Tax=Streptomyces sp. NPDC052225 TaxID=3154949 RepID=UPI00341CC329